MTDPTWAMLADSWELSMRADGYAENTIRAYRKAFDAFVDFLGADVPPEQITRDHVRAWLVHVRTTRSAGTARSQYAGIRHFVRWAVSEGEMPTDPTEGIRSPVPPEPVTPVLSLDQIRRLVDSCKGATLPDKRDRALLLVFLDGGLRLSEAAGLRVSDIDVRDRMLYVEGKGSGRSGPRRRAVPVGIKTAQAIDRYLRARVGHPWASAEALWLGDRNRGPMSTDGVKRALMRRGRAVGIDLHPHMLRHTWASQFRAAGGSEGDLMVLGGWRSRQMLDRYGSVVAGDRARDAYRRLSLGDRL